MTSMAIDVDNLCSFMPQDKVGQFTQQTPKGILQKTLQAIVSEDRIKTYHDIQKDLSNVEKVKSDKDRELKAKVAAKDAKQNEVAGMKVEVERIEQREEAEEKLKLYETRKIIKDFEEGETTKREKQGLVDEAEKKLNEAKALIQPLETESRRLNAECAKCEQQNSNLQKKHKTAEAGLANAASIMEQCDVDIEAASNELSSIDVRRREDEEKLEKSRQALEKHQVNFQRATENVPTVKREVDALTQSIRQKGEALLDLEDKEKEILTIHHRENDELKQCQRSLTGLVDATELFKAKVRGNNNLRFYQNALHALDWLNQNKAEFMQSHKLRGDVYGPVAMLMNVEDPACAVMIEKVVSPAKLMGFIVTNEADKNFLRAEFKKMNWKIDVYTVEHMDPIRHRSNATDLRAHFHDIGMKGYLIDEIECEEIVKVLLAGHGGLGEVMWARMDEQTQCRELSQEHFNRLCPDGTNGFRLFVDNKNASAAGRGGGGGGRGGGRGGGGGGMGEISDYSGSRSRYNRNAPPSISSINVLPKNIVGKSGDDSQDQRVILESKIQEIRQRIHGLDDSLQSLRNDRTPLKDEIDDLRGKKNQFAEHLKMPGSIQKLIDSE